MYSQSREWKEKVTGSPSRWREKATGITSSWEKYNSNKHPMVNRRESEREHRFLFRWETKFRSRSRRFKKRLQVRRRLERRNFYFKNRSMKARRRESQEAYIETESKRGRERARETESRGERETRWREKCNQQKDEREMKSARCPAATKKGILGLRLAPGQQNGNDNINNSNVNDKIMVIIKNNNK